MNVPTFLFSLCVPLTIHLPASGRDDFPSMHMSMTSGLAVSWPPQIKILPLLRKNSSYGINSFCMLVFP
jgi:hypothetical protein